MNPERIAELLTPFLETTVCGEGMRGLSEPGHVRGEQIALLSSWQLENISTYIDILVRWNSRVNLTAIRDPEKIVTRHFGESLFVARHLFPSVSSRVTGGEVADFGSGAGFPGVPIKLWAPDIALTLIESNQKKATFLREVVRALELTGVTVQNVRAETLPVGSFDVVTLRAVERRAYVLPTAGRLLAPVGRLALLTTESQKGPVRSALPSFSWLEPQPIPKSEARLLLIGRRTQGG